MEKNTKNIFNWYLVTDTTDYRHGYVTGRKESGGQLFISARLKDARVEDDAIVFVDDTEEIRCLLTDIIPYTFSEEEFRKIFAELDEEKTEALLDAIRGPIEKVNEEYKDLITIPDVFEDNPDYHKTFGIDGGEKRG